MKMAISFLVFSFILSLSSLGAFANDHAAVPADAAPAPSAQAAPKKTPTAAPSKPWKKKKRRHERY